MRKIYFFSALLFVSISSLFIFNQYKDDPRVAYEKFILEKAAFHANVETEKTALKSPDKPEMAAFQEFVKTVDPQLGYDPKSGSGVRIKQHCKQQQKRKTCVMAQPSNGRALKPIWEEEPVH